MVPRQTVVISMIGKQLSKINLNRIGRRRSRIEGNSILFVWSILNVLIFVIFSLMANF